MRREGASFTDVRAMTMRKRKLLGTVALLIFLSAYAILAMLVAVVLQVRESKVVELTFYAVAGLAWLLPAGLLIRWMHRPERAVDTGDNGRTGRA
jgi:hypothetical protein